jgi:hypothetical protein
MVVLRRGVVGGFVSFAHGFELFGGVEGVIGMAGFDELLGVFGVDGFPFALAIGAVGAGLFGGFVGLQAGPFEAVEDISFGAGDKPALIRIFDAEDEVAAMFAGEKIVV